jgi:DNA polymerase-3 subunit delta'
VVTGAHAGFLGLGQSSARDLLVGAVRNGRIGGTLLVHGPRGVDLKAFTDDLLALLLCADPDADARPCNACRGCRDGRARSHPDLVVGSPSAWRDARSGGESIVAVARRWLASASGAPIVADRRVVVVEQADEANEQTQNVLLKALEEPSRRQLFILLATDVSRLLPTIRSRCQSLRLGPVARDALVEWLMEERHLPLDQARSLARIADGMAGAAADYADTPGMLDWRRRTQAELLGLLKRGRAARLAAVRELVDAASAFASSAITAPMTEEPAADGEPVARTSSAQQRAAALLVLGAWTDLARDLALAASGRPELAPSVELLPEIADLAPRLSPVELAATTRRFERIREGLVANAAPRLAMAVAAIAWPRLPSPA